MMKDAPGRGHGSRLGPLALGVMLGLAGGQAALANPTGPTVVHGGAAFGNPGPHTLNITNTPGAIINWRGFSIGAQETTRFIQPSAASRVLNRVTGGDPSQIMGRLLSNGRVFLINPSGILFGRDSVIDTAGFLASTLDIDDRDFIEGRFAFEGGPEAGTIENRGYIRSGPGGEVVLIAPSIENSGIVETDGGELVLAAGRKVTLTSLDDPDITFELQAPDDSVINLGELLAENGTVRAFAGTIDNSGTVSADGVRVDEGGRVVLFARHRLSVEAGGSVSASGAAGGDVTLESAAGDTLVAGRVEAIASAGRGGRIHVLGERVGLTDEAVVDASGAAGGGEVLVGGDRQGRNPAVRNAAQTYAGPGTAIAADATDAGDGGKVVLWADGTAQAYGAISARGGERGGDGGFVETSGKRHLDVTRGPDVRAPAGEAGTWLLDPRNIEVAAGGALTNNLNAPFFTPLGEMSVVGAELINAQLDLGSDVILDTTGESPDALGDDPGNIVVNAPIRKTASGPEIGATELEMRAHNNIEVNAEITSSGDPLAVYLRADNDADDQGSVAVNAPITTAGGRVDIMGAGIAASSSIVTDGGGVYLDSEGALAVTGPVSTGGGFIDFYASDGQLTVASMVDSGGGGIDVRGFGAGGTVMLASSATINAGNGFTFIESQAPATIHLQSGSQVNGGSVTLEADAMNIAGNVNASSDIIVRTFSSGHDITLGSEVGGTLSLTAAELNRLGSPVGLEVGDFNTGTLTVTGAVNRGNGFLEFNAGAFNVNPGASVAAPGIITVSADGAELGGTVSSTGGGRLTIFPRSFNRQITLGTEVANTLSLTDAELDRLSTAGALTLGSFSNTGNINLTAPVSPGGVDTLGLLTRLSITQTAGSTLTETNARLESSFGQVNLPEANQVGVLAGSADTQFLFANAAPLQVAPVDGKGNIDVSGFSSPNLELRADAMDLTISLLSFGGDVTLRPFNAATPVTLGGEVGGTLSLTDFELDRALGSTVNLNVLADTIDVAGPIDRSSTDLTIAPVTDGRDVTLGGEVGGTLSLTDAELDNITMPSFATLIIGGDSAGDIDTAGPLTRTGNLRLVAGAAGDGGTASLIDSITLASDLTVEADIVDIDAAMDATTGSVFIVTDDFTIGGGGITAADRVQLGVRSAGTTIDFGLGTTPGALNIDEGDVVSFFSAPTLAVGSDSVSGPVVVTAPVLLPASIDNLELYGTDFTQAGGGTITASDAIKLGFNTAEITEAITSTGGEAIIVDRLFSGSIFLGAELGSLSLKDSELDLLTTAAEVQVGDLFDPVASTISIQGPVAPAGTSELLLNAQSTISQTAGSTITGVTSLGVTSSFGTVSLPEANDVGVLAGSSGGDFDFSDVDDLTVGATTFGPTGIFSSFGDINLAADDLTVSQAVDGFTVLLTPATPARAVVLGGTDPGGVLHLAQADLDNISAFELAVTADEVDVATPGPVDINATSLRIEPVDNTLPIELGADDIPGTSLGLTDAELGAVNLIGSDITVGSFAHTGGITVVSPVDLTGGPDLFVETDGTVTVNDDVTADFLAIDTGVGNGVDVNAIITGNFGVDLYTDAVNFGGGSVESPFNVSWMPNGPASLSFPAIDLDNFTAGTLTVGSFGTDITVTGPVSPANVTNLVLQGDSFTVDPGAGLTLPGTIEVGADDMDLGGNLVSSGDQDVTLRTQTSFRQVDLGTETAGRLSLVAAELDRVMTGGALVVGRTFSSGAINVTMPIAPGGVTTLALLSSSSINQQTGATITENALRVQGSAVTLQQNNQVSTLAGSGSTLNFTNAAPLTIGSVDGFTGLSTSTATLNVDSLDVATNVSGFNVTVAPRTAGRAIRLGAEAGSALSLTDGELDRFFVSNLNIGDGQSGAITVAGAVDPNGASNLNLVSGPATINVNAPLTMGGNIGLQSDAVNINAAVESLFGQIQVQPLTIGLPMTLGGTAPGTLSLTAAELDRLSVSEFDWVRLGSSATGPVSIAGNLAPAGFQRLNIISGAGISQASGTGVAIDWLDLDAFDGNVQLPGSNVVSRLNGFAGGTDHDFIFNNAAPMLLQNIGVSNASGGRTLITSAGFVPPFLRGGGEEIILPVNELLILLANSEEEEDEEGEDLADAGDEDDEGEGEPQECR